MPDACEYYFTLFFRKNSQAPCIDICAVQTFSEVCSRTAVIGSTRIAFHWYFCELFHCGNGLLDFSFSVGLFFRVFNSHYESMIGSMDAPVVVNQKIMQSLASIIR